MIHTHARSGQHPRARTSWQLGGVASYLAFCHDHRRLSEELNEVGGGTGSNHQKKKFA